MSAGPGRIPLHLPQWVVPPEAVVAETELTVLGWGAETGAPGPVASWRALQWVAADNGTPAPATDERCVPTRDRAVAEYEMSAAILAGEPFPDDAWFAGHGLGPDELPNRRWWETLARSEWGREVGRGSAAALGWLLGSVSGPEHMVPFRYEDGSPVPDSVRSRWTDRLRERIG